MFDSDPTPKNYVYIYIDKAALKAPVPFGVLSHQPGLTLFHNVAFSGFHTPFLEMFFVDLRRGHIFFSEKQSSDCQKMQLGAITVFGKRKRMKKVEKRALASVH